MIEELKVALQGWLNFILGSALCLALLWLAWVSYNYRKQKEMLERLERIEKKLDNSTVVIK